MWHSTLDEAAQPGRPVTVDIDGDALTDLIAALGDCGNWGDCLHVVLQGCPGDRFRAVWGPDYAQRIDVGERERNSPIAPLILGGRTAMAGCDVPTRSTAAWRDGAWSMSQPCASSAGVWSDECGAPPPACP